MWRNQAIRQLAWFHRWLGITTCLVFALWFASGAVLLFKPFPSLSRADQLRLEAPIDVTKVAVSPRAAAAAAGRPISALRLVERAGAPAYIATTPTGLIAIDARSGQHLPDLPSTAIAREPLAKSGTASISFIDYDQWVVHNRFDPFRPFYRVEIADPVGTNVYISAKTGELLQRTTASDRGWNWVGSVLHWAYFTPLRSSFTAWDRTVWIVSFIALLVAIAGTILGVVHMLAARRQRKPSLSFYRLRWMRWHHVLGLFASVFVLTWMLSGWLSMDHGRLFSRGEPTPEQSARYSGTSLLNVLPDQAAANLPAATRQIEFTAVDGRGLVGAWQPDGSILHYTADYSRVMPRQIRAMISAAALRAFPAASSAGVTPIDMTSTYALAEGWPSTTLRVALSGPGLPDIYVDGSDGKMLTVMDGSRASYAWIYYALHTLNFPGLTSRPLLRQVLVLVPMLIGFLFSITGAIVGLQRLRKSI